MRAKTILAFASIFIIWGSTYLAIRYAVAEIPPFLTAGIRHLTAGSLLFAWAWLKGRRASAVEWRHSAVVGALFFLIGHGSLHWAEQSVPSGLSALLVATEPIWIAMLLALTGQSPLRLRTVAGLLVGLLGVWLLVGVDGVTNDRAVLVGSLAVLVGAASWGAGVVYSQRAPLPADPILRTATTLLCGAVMLLTTSAAFGELRYQPRPSSLALLSLGYLIVFGSIVSFTAYYWLLDRYPATMVATHTYINPAVAVLLGSLIGDEAVSAELFVGLAVVSSAIALVRTPSAESNAPPSQGGRATRLREA
jgi:drug/metabolite transporter (DMT)-like permease